MNALRKTYLLSIFLAVPLFAQTTIRASKPSHYFFVPTAYLNPPHSLVLSLHEIAYSLPGHLQLHMSIFDNVGRINFGARYGFDDHLSVGVGMAHTFIETPGGGHGITDGSPRLGLFLAWGITKTRSFETCLVPHMQIGDHFSMGGDFALKATSNNFWSFIWEVGTSADLTDSKFYFNTDAGIRIHPPSIPYLSFDVGIDLIETPVNNYKPRVAPYFDVIFAMFTN